MQLSMSQTHFLDPTVMKVHVQKKRPKTYKISTEKLITVKIPKCDTVKLWGNNYVDVIQGSKEWLVSRVGIIAASKILALLGLCGHKEFDGSWFCIHNRLDESLHKPKNFKNFERGKAYERAALDSFTKASGKLSSKKNRYPVSFK